MWNKNDDIFVGVGFSNFRRANCVLREILVRKRVSYCLNSYLVWWSIFYLQRSRRVRKPSNVSHSTAVHWASESIANISTRVCCPVSSGIEGVFISAAHATRRESGCTVGPNLQFILHRTASTLLPEVALFNGKIVIFWNQAKIFFIIFWRYITY